MLSEKLKDLKVYQNFKFSKGKKTNAGQRWVCTDKNCRCSIYTDTKDNVVQQRNIHNHLADDTLSRQALSNAAKRKAVDDICSKPSKHVRNEISKLPEEMRNSLTIADLNRAKKNTYSQKRALYPRQPRNIIEVHETVNSMEVNTKSKNECLIN